MLSQTCQQFRDGYTIAGEHSHLGDCAACRAWAEKVSGLSRCRLDLPLPESLRNRLLVTVSPASPVTRIDPLPQLPVPGTLQQRLLAIPDQQAQAPSWLLKLRYGVAASLILTFVSVSALGSTINRGHQSALSWSQQLDQSLQAAKIRGQEALASAGETAAEVYGTARTTVINAPDQISSGLTGLSTRLIGLLGSLGSDSAHQQNQKETSNGDTANNANRPE
jgi:hypothetical protein